MKIIFLNTWGGERRKPLLDFIFQQSSDTNIFCFQELSANIKTQTDKVLENFHPYTSEKILNAHDAFYQTIYVRKDISVISHGTLLGNDLDCGLAVYVEITGDEQNTTVCNVHGIARPSDKLDNPARLKQSSTIIDFFKSSKGTTIIGGDFNMLPNTESIEMFAKNGYNNLIEDFKIKTTRNHFVWDKFPGTKQYYADYVFVSKDIQVDGFEVIDNEISDHLPLILSW